MSEKTMEKLRILLSHWIDHNHSHESEMEKWQSFAEEEGQQKAAELIGKAIKGMQETDDALALALTELGGEVDGHHHHHH